MDPKVVAETWGAFGLSDLFVAFCIQDRFYSHARSLEILALEKLMKALLLYRAGDEYLTLSFDAAKQKVNDLAKGWGHSLKRMLAEWAAFAFEDKVNVLLAAKYGGYGGDALVGVMQQGYFESRYPVPTHSSDRFPTDEPGINWDPINSSAITELVHSLTRLWFHELKCPGIASSAWNAFQDTCRENKDDLRRFTNVLLHGRPEDYL